MSTPTATTPGYGVFRGRVACTCLISWLPVIERELQDLGVIKGPLPIAQLVGTAAASAGTHKGGAVDLWTVATEVVRIARQMGADATWVRTKAQGFDPHIHGVLRGCHHNAAARYQIAAVDAGYNGLGPGGRGGTDDGPRPLSGRTWREGITWAKRRQRVRRINAKIQATKATLARLRKRRAQVRAKG